MTPAESLRRYPLFKLPGEEAFAAWVESGAECAWATGELIVQEGTPGAWVYLVREGRVRVVRRSGDRDVTVAMLQPDDVFGDYALLPPGRNTATCRAASPARAWRLPLAPARAQLQALPNVWRNLKNWLRLHTLLQHLRDRAFLGFMSADSALKLLDRLQPMILPAGQTVQASGLAGDRWFVVEQGRVRVGDEEIGPGTSFGEAGLAGSGPVLTASAVTDVRLHCLARQDFEPGAPASPSQASLVAQSYLPRPEPFVFVPQLEEADCGLAALAMVARSRGRPTTVEELRGRAAPGPRGLSLQQLRELAGAVGLPGQAVRVSAQRLGLVSLPAIAHLRDGHYVVLYQVGPGGVVVGDPAAGVVTWGVEFLVRVYSEALLVFGP